MNGVMAPDTCRRKLKTEGKFAISNFLPLLIKYESEIYTILFPFYIRPICDFSLQCQKISLTFLQ